MNRRRSQAPDSPSHTVPRINVDQKFTAPDPGQPPYPEGGENIDPRRLFADLFWGDPRRFLDSLPPISSRPRSSGSVSSSGSSGSFHTRPTAEALRALNAVSGAGDRGNGPKSSNLPRPGPPPPEVPRLPPSPPSSDTTPPQPQDPMRPPPPPLSPPPPPHDPSDDDYPMSSSSTSSDTPAAAPPGFLHCPGYAAHAIKPRAPFSVPSRREEFVDALAELETERKGVKIKGVGKLARPLLNKSHSPKLLAHFLDRAERQLLVPITAAPVPAPAPAPRVLAQLESELFDTAKYVGGSAARNLTVLTWSEDSPYGSITLFEVDVDVEARGGARAAAAERVARIRPVAAMEDVPRQILVRMRVDAGLKKDVLWHSPASGRFCWSALAAARRGGRPRYARVMLVERVLRMVEHAVPGGRDSGRRGDDGGRPGRARRGRRAQDGAAARRRERSALRAAGAPAVAGRRVRIAQRVAKDYVHVSDGVVATIPQFLALLHASRSVLETASSGSVDLSLTTDGESVRSVTLGSPLTGPRPRGRDVHVAVLVPDGAEWADERIFWADDGGALAELRQKKYRDVIGGTIPRNGPGRHPGNDPDARS
ncbi:3a98cda4-6081-486e-81fa-19fad4e1f4a8 [Thermothielavioides terrestris]|nr:3a98cda4-6081-486e-81fa-19fad4e1f4a8 [Thermothielavioides terrestris]